jgi:predicted alpha/beta-fold hydrolase
MEGAVTIRLWTVWPRYRRELLDLEDRGVVGLDWWEDTDLPALPKSAPVLIVITGITGNGHHLLTMSRLLYRMVFL